MRCKMNVNTYGLDYFIIILLTSVAIGKEKTRPSKQLINVKEDSNCKK